MRKIKNKKGNEKEIAKNSFWRSEEHEKIKKSKKKKKRISPKLLQKKQKQKNCISLISKSENKMAHKEMIKFRKKIRWNT